MSQALLETIRVLKSSPARFVGKECVLSLEAFLFGYKQSDSSIVDVVQRLASAFPGPDEVGGCGKAFLAHRDPREAFVVVLDVLERLLESEQCSASGVPPSGTFVDMIRDGVKQGRPGMVLGEATVDWLADYAHGYLAGLMAVDPVEGSAQQRQLQDFEQWLQRSYDAAASWHGIIRVYYGPGSEGVAKLVDHWDDFIREQEAAATLP